MPSVKRNGQSSRFLVALALGGALVTGGLGGCSTTQEKAAAHRAESERILEAREKRQEKKKQERKHKEKR